jgi:hypothetical protein
MTDFSNLNGLSLIELVKIPELQPLLSKVKSFAINPLDDKYKTNTNYRHYTLTVECKSEGLYAVCDMFNEQVTKNGVWSYENSASNRTEKFKKSHRFPLAQALEIAIKESQKLETPIGKYYNMVKYEEAKEAVELELTKVAKNNSTNSSIDLARKQEMIYDFLIGANPDDRLVNYINMGRKNLPNNH